MSHNAPIRMKSPLRPALRPRLLSSAEVEGLIDTTALFYSQLPDVVLTPLQRMQLSGNLFPGCSNAVDAAVGALQIADGQLGPADGPRRAGALAAGQGRASTYLWLSLRLQDLAQVARDLYLLEQTQALDRVKELVGEARWRTEGGRGSRHDGLWLRTLAPAERRLRLRGQAPRGVMADSKPLEERPRRKRRRQDDDGSAAQLVVDSYVHGRARPQAAEAAAAEAVPPPPAEPAAEADPVAAAAAEPAAPAPVADPPACADPPPQPSPPPASAAPASAPAGVVAEPAADSGDAAGAARRAPGGPPGPRR